MSAVDVIIFWGDGCSPSSEKTENFKLGRCNEFGVPRKSFHREGRANSSQKFEDICRVLLKFSFNIISLSSEQTTMADNGSVENQMQIDEGLYSRQLWVIVQPSDQYSRVFKLNVYVSLNFQLYTISCS